MAVSGIGVTPIMAMAQAAQRAGRVEVVPMEEVGLLDLDAVVAAARAGRQVYSCGPAALRAAGHEVASSCEQGVCGLCETRVLDGVPDHRDMLLSDSERAQGNVMMLCVSRALTPTLTLDL